VDINDLIVAILLSWVLPLGLFVYYFVTDPVRGAKRRRTAFDLRSLNPVSKLLLAQKLDIILVILFIACVRFFGRSAVTDWIALALYVSLVVLAWCLFAVLRRMQVDRERRIRRGADPDHPTSKVKE
jgi:hypothetical protein